MVAFPDIKPAAKHHTLVISKQHVLNAKVLTSEHKALGKFFFLFLRAQINFICCFLLLKFILWSLTDTSDVINEGLSPRGSPQYIITTVSHHHEFSCFVYFFQFKKW